MCLTISELVKTSKSEDLDTSYLKTGQATIYQYSYVTEGTSIALRTVLPASSSILCKKMVLYKVQGTKDSSSGT